VYVVGVRCDQRPTGAASFYPYVHLLVTVSAFVEHQFSLVKKKQVLLAVPGRHIRNTEPACQLLLLLPLHGRPA
jgi:hypothetical protein